jgi:superfamily I DNA/RNA helicase
MADWAINVELTTQQQNVLELTQSAIIKGVAGSGKTLTAVHLAKKLKDKEFLFIVYTISLKEFINDGIRELQIDNAKVMYAWEWQSKKSDPEKSADYILVDEAQDFNEDFILLLKSKARKGIFFFGDSAQQVFSEPVGVGKVGTNVKPTINIEEIEKITNLSNIIDLGGNHRLYESVAKVAQLINSGGDIVSNCKKKGGNKPIVKKCSSEQAQLDWIADLIKAKELKDVAILIPTNLAKENSYAGVLEASIYLKDKGLNLGVRYVKDSRTHSTLSFKSDVINMMPYHSAKGLQFKNVFLPFYSVGEREWKKAFFVALTRTSDNLYITTYPNDNRDFLSRATRENLVDVI